MDAKKTFDEYSGKYKKSIESAIPASLVTVDFCTETKIFFIEHFIEKNFGNKKNKHSKQIQILDIGCGVGETDTFLKKKYPSITGVDISEESLKQAKIKNPELTYLNYQGNKLPFENDGKLFDVILCINVLHHVPLEERDAFIRECKRVMKPGGLFIVIEHNPYNPLTLYTVKKCEFDKDALLLRRRELSSLLKNISSNSLQEYSYILMFPFAKKIFRKMELKLGKIPLGAQYILVNKFN